MAAREQHALGFIWDSVTLTRTLEDRKLSFYLALLSEYAGLPTLNLRQMQEMAGKLHRMLMTLPPGSACLAASLFDAPGVVGLHVGAVLGRLLSERERCIDWFIDWAARRPIDFRLPRGRHRRGVLERLAHKWQGCVVQFFIDRGGA